MRLRRGTIILAVVPIFYLLSCAGCGSHQIQVALKSYEPWEKTALEGPRPMTVALQVVDWRPVESGSSIPLTWKSVFGTRHIVVVTEPNMIQAIYDAMKREMEDDGNHVLHAEEGNADVTVRIAVTQLLFDTNKATSTYVDFAERIRAEVTASAASADAPQVRFPFESKSGTSLGLGWVYSLTLGEVGGPRRDSVASMMSYAVEQFVRQLCMKEEFRGLFAPRYRFQRRPQ
jgi:hypothetical protein